MLKFNGNDIPEPKADGGIQIKKEKIWSKNTKRASNALLVGDVVAIKYTISISWPPLSDGEVVLIDSYMELPSINVTFKDPRTGQIITKSFYSGTPSYPVYSYEDGVAVYTGVAVDLIEK